jgi:hypothetical protein
MRVTSIRLEMQFCAEVKTGLHRAIPPLPFAKARKAMKKLDVKFRRRPGDLLLVGTLAEDRGRVFFEYSPILEISK